MRLHQRSFSPVRRNALAFFMLAALGAISTGCSIEQDHFDRPMKLGGKWISAKTLNVGYRAYQQYCFACHGEKGDGQGPAAPGYHPPPRNFGQAVFKFAGVAEGKLPSDEDLDRIIHHGLNGTPMWPWDIPEQQRHAIIQYIKTFKTEANAKRAKELRAKDGICWSGSLWQERFDCKTKKVVKELKQEPPFFPKDPDPFAGGADKAQRGIALGKLVYHTLAQCTGCHPAYITHQEFNTIVDDALKAGVIKTPLPVEARSDAYFPQGKESKTYNTILLPPDFTLHPVRSVRWFCPSAPGHVCDEEQRLGDIYRILYTGIPGAAMPPWASLPPEQLWGLVHYVKWLHDKQLPGGDAAEFRLGFTDPARNPFVPKPVPPPAPEPAPAAPATPSPGTEVPAPAPPAAPAADQP